MGFDEKDYRRRAMREARDEMNRFYFSHSPYERRIQMRIDYIAERLGWRRGMRLPEPGR